MCFGCIIKLVVFYLCRDATRFVNLACFRNLLKKKNVISREGTPWEQCIPVNPFLLTSFFSQNLNDILLIKAYFSLVWENKNEMYAMTVDRVCVVFEEWQHTNATRNWFQSTRHTYATTKLYFAADCCALAAFLRGFSGSCALAASFLRTS